MNTKSLLSALEKARVDGRTLTQIQISEAISAAIKTLLSEKHLYQSVEVDFGFLDKRAASNREVAQIAAYTPRTGGGGPHHVVSLDSFRRELSAQTDGPWCPQNVLVTEPRNQTAFEGACGVIVPFSLPTITTTCGACGKHGPFNPLRAFVESDRPSLQWVTVPYLCQYCKEGPIRFLLRRTENRLTLAGRDPFETIELPSFLPKKQSQHFRNAIIANHAGQTLAGIFLLRVFVEQYWKSVPEVVNALKDKVRPTGDEMAEAYKDTLPTDFKGRFPTLAEVYGLLSEAMHLANADAELFANCHTKIIEHFDARKLFKLQLSMMEETTPAK